MSTLSWSELKGRSSSQVRSLAVMEAGDPEMKGILSSRGNPAGGRREDVKASVLPWNQTQPGPGAAPGVAGASDLLVHKPCITVVCLRKREAAGWSRAPSSARGRVPLGMLQGGWGIPPGPPAP